MAFVRLMCKAAQFDKRKLELDQEKKYAVQKSRGEPEPKRSLKQKYRHGWLDCVKKLRKAFRKRFTFPKNSCIFRCCYKIRHDGSCENYTLKSVVGFIGGFLITYVFFMFSVFQLNFKFSTATIMCSIFGSILTIGLAFSYKVRCIVFLTLPQLFSKRGRQALLAYAFILAITGPAKNTLNNMGILSESLACGQEQLKAAVKQILEVVKKPFYAIRDAIRTVVKVVKVIVRKIKEILLTIKRIIMAIVKVIKSVFEFLAKIINICNKELGTPFQRCTRVFENAITDCYAKLGPAFSWLCSLTYLVQSVCYTVKMFDFVCEIVDFISNSIVGVVVRKIRTFVRHIKTMFYVRIKFSHSFHFETNASKSLEDVATGIVTEIKARTQGLVKVFDFMSCATSLFFMFIIFRVLYYRYKFLTDERFDNRFITKDFRTIDMRRAQLGKETVLPLNHRERNKYIAVGSCRLVKKEKLKLSQSAVVLGMASLKLATHMTADYVLFWVLLQIRAHGSFQSTFEGSSIPTLHVKGEGLLADLLRSIVKAFQPVGLRLEIDTIPCLPDPIPPDYDRYVQIASLLVICWLLMIFEPFGLRWRHSVMCFYHPQRAKERSIWLYNHILRTRSSFLKFARRQLRRKFKGDPNITKITCKEYLRANLRCRVFRLCLGKDLQMYCLLCGEVFRENEPIKPIRCQTPNCPGIYCEKCFQDLQNICTVCLDPIQYGDLSDISEEKDSSEVESKDRKWAVADDIGEEETDSEEKKRKRKKKRKHIRKKSTTEDDSDTDSDDEERSLLASDSLDLSTTISSTKSTPDSDYYSSEPSTDLSYSYQYRKDITEKAEEPPRRTFVDVEKQRIPDYALMDTFRDLPSNTKSDTSSETGATYGSRAKKLKPVKIAHFTTPESSEIEFVDASDTEKARGLSFTPSETDTCYKIKRNVGAEDLTASESAKTIDSERTTDLSRTPSETDSCYELKRNVGTEDVTDSESLETNRRKKTTYTRTASHTDSCYEVKRNLGIEEFALLGLHPREDYFEENYKEESISTAPSTSISKSSDISLRDTGKTSYIPKRKTQAIEGALYKDHKNQINPSTKIARTKKEQEEAGSSITETTFIETPTQSSSYITEPSSKPQRQHSSIDTVSKVLSGKITDRDVNRPRKREHTVTRDSVKNVKDPSTANKILFGRRTTQRKPKTRSIHTDTECVNQRLSVKARKSGAAADVPKINLDFTKCECYKKECTKRPCNCRRYDIVHYSLSNAPSKGFKESKHRPKKIRSQDSSTETTFIETPNTSDSEAMSSSSQSRSRSKFLSEPESKFKSKDNVKAKRQKSYSQTQKYRYNVESRRGYDVPKEVPRLNLDFATCECGKKSCPCKKFDVHYHTESETSRSHKGSIRSLMFSPLSDKMMAAEHMKSSPETNISSKTRTTSSSTLASNSTNTTSTYNDSTPLVRSSPQDTINYLYDGSTYDDFLRYNKATAVEEDEEGNDANKKRLSFRSFSNTTESDGNSRSYKNKVRSYYSKLKTESFDNPGIKRDRQSKFTRFINRLLRKA